MFLVSMLLVAHALLLSCGDAQPFWGMSITCVHDDCSRAVHAISVVLNVSEQAIIVWGTANGQLDVSFDTQDNQSLYQQITSIRRDPTKNSPLAEANIVFISLAASPFATTISPRTSSSPTGPPNSTRATVDSSPNSGLSQAGIVGISVSLTFVLFIAVFAFSKWYMWRYEKSQRYKLELGGAEPEMHVDGDSVVPPATSFALTDQRAQPKDVSVESDGSAEGGRKEQENDDFEFVVE